MFYYGEEHLKFKKYELKYRLYILLCKWEEKQFQVLRKERSKWELSPGKGKKVIGFF